MKNKFFIHYLKTQAEFYDVITFIFAEVDDGMCSKEPCQNVGQCIAYNTCYCPPGWFGLRCEYR